MDLKQIALDNKILEIYVGSHLYGTNTPDSDIDLNGIFVAPKEFYLGLKTVNEVDLSTVSKKENGRNDKDAVDRKFYELRKFINLAARNNPNIVEQLFVNNENIMYGNSLGYKLLENRYIFPYKGCYDSFIGYSISQKKKMIIKKDNMNDIILALEFFNGCDVPSRNYVVQYKKQILNAGFQNVKDTGQHIQIGDTTIQKNDTIKQAIRKLSDRRNKFSSRFDDFVSKSGYDTKFASHLIRLLLEGKELLETGSIEFPLKGKELILDIKSGKYTLDNILDLSDDLEFEMEKALNESQLPDKPQIDKIETLLIELVEESWSTK